MPYITLDRRKALDTIRDPRERGKACQTAGELNYCLTAATVGHRGEERLPLVWGYVDGHGRRYATFNDVVGALTCASLELRRRLPSKAYLSRAVMAQARRYYAAAVAPYEDVKIAENGDVYPEEPLP